MINWYKKNKERIYPAIKERYKNLPNEIKNERYKKYKEKRPKDYIKNYHKKRWESDSNYRIACLIRSSVTKILLRNQKSGKGINELGCSSEELKKYIESKFKDGMTWKNRGRKSTDWHIDHIKSLSTFDLTDKEQYLKACHYTNLQPLWARENLKKYNH